MIYVYACTYQTHRIWLNSGGLCYYIIAYDEDSSSMLLQDIYVKYCLILNIHNYIHTSKYVFVFESQNSCSHQSDACFFSRSHRKLQLGPGQAHDEKNAFVEFKMFMAWIDATM